MVKALAFGADFVMIGGMLADALGRRPVVLGGLLIYTLAGLLGATALSPAFTPAWAREGKVLCFYQPAHRFKTRYGTFGFSEPNTSPR